MRRCDLTAVAFGLSLVAFLTRAGGQELFDASAMPAEPAAKDAGERFTLPPATPGRPLTVGDLETDRLGSFDSDSLLAMAAQNNPTLRQARLHVSSELAKAQQAGLYPNPTLSYSGEQIFVDIDGDTDSPGEFQGGIVSQRLVTAGKLRLSREKYLRRAHISEHLAVAQQYRVCNDIRMHYYRALAAQQRVELHRELVKTAEDASVTVRELFNLGQAPRFQVRKANIELQRSRLNLQRVEHEYRARFRELSSVVGVEIPVGSVTGSLGGTESQISFDEALGRVLEQSPELLAARAKLAADRATIRREEVEWVPDFVVSAGSGYNFEAKETVAVAGVSIEIPLFDRNQGTVNQARADYRRQQNEIRRIELILRRKLAAVFGDYALAYEHAAGYRDTIVPEARAAYEELLQSYRANRVAWPEVLRAQRDYSAMRIDQIDYEEQLRRSEVLIHGFLLHDGLRAAEGPIPPGHIDAVPKPR